jgi:hypothetical protein
MKIAALMKKTVANYKNNLVLQIYTSLIHLIIDLMIKVLLVMYLIMQNQHQKLYLILLIVSFKVL